MKPRLLRTPQCLLAHPSQPLHFPLHRSISSSPSLSSELAADHTPPPDSRWLSSIKARVGKCIIFGMSHEQTTKAAGVLKILGEEWRDLVAGREGYVVDKRRAGLWRQGVVWGEMDCMGHVNNVMYTRYAESARVNWAYNYGIHCDPEHRKEWTELMTPNGIGLILKTMTTDYKFPMKWPDHITVLHKLRSLPSPTSHSFILDVIILSELHQRPAARCVEDIVTYNYTLGRKTEIPDFMMKGFERVWGEQEEERRKAVERVKMVEEQVRKIEKGSWDREGAVEDMGGAR